MVNKAFTSGPQKSDRDSAWEYLFLIYFVQITIEKIRSTTKWIWKQRNNKGRVAHKFFNFFPLCAAKKWNKLIRSTAKQRGTETYSNNRRTVKNCIIFCFFFPFCTHMKSNRMENIENKNMKKNKNVNNMQYSR